MANKKKRKKRIKRQLKRLSKQTDKSVITPEIKYEILQDQNKSWLNPVIVDSGIEPPTTELYLGKYEAENREYQVLLNEYYGGTVKPIERFITMNANILHHCDQCGQEFFGKPKWILGLDHQKHLCTMPYGDSFGNRSSAIRNKGAGRDVKVKRHRTTTEEQKALIPQLAKQGLSANDISKQLKLDKSTVKYYLNKQG